ncbi:hypothetical protein M9458_022792, partial [Cirrhinus mrigala]
QKRGPGFKYASNLPGSLLKEQRMNRDVKDEPESNMSTESYTSTVSPVMKKKSEREDNPTCKSEDTFKKRSPKLEDNPLRKKRKLFEKDSDSESNVKKKKKRSKPEDLSTSNVLGQIKTEREDDEEYDEDNRQELERRAFSFEPSEEEDGDDEGEEEEEEEETMKESSREENGKLVHKTSAAWEGDQSQGGLTQAGPSSDSQLRSQRKTKRKPRLPNKELSKELSKQLNQEIQKTEDRLAHQNGRVVKTEPDSDEEDRKPLKNGSSHLRDWLGPKRELNGSLREQHPVNWIRTTPTPVIRPTPCRSPPKCVQMERHVIRPPPISPPPDGLPLDDGKNHVMRREVWMAVFSHLTHQDL